MKPPLIVSLGLGVDSTAVLVGLKEREIIPDLIIFANTGGEKPDTYKYLLILQKWCRKVGFPKIKSVARPPLKKPGKRREGVDPNAKYKTLEENCLVNKILPSIAYGRKACSIKYKKDPVNKLISKWPPAIECWNSGSKPVQVLGFEFGEERRAIPEDEKITFWYPLIEWKWDRIECLKAIARSGLPIPPKSSCFFCPAMTKREIVNLSQQHPDLLERALRMEERAKPEFQTIKGLGRSFNWAEFLESRKASIPGFDDLWDEPPVHACGCWDGGGTDRLIP